MQLILHFYRHPNPITLTLADTTGSLLGTTTGRSTQEATPTNELSETTPPGHGRCAYCGSVMPNLKLIMHERHCAQSTFKCPLCK